MKKIILAIALLVFAGTRTQTASAHESGWPIAGAVIGGVVAASVISHALAPEPCYQPAGYSYSAPTYAYGGYNYCPPRVVYAPAPVVVYRAPVYVAPVVHFGYGYGGYYGHGHYGHGYYGGHHHGRW